MIVAFLMAFVMPKVVGIFEGMDMVLPWSTRFLIQVTDLFRTWWWAMLGGRSWRRRRGALDPHEAGPASLGRVPAAGPGHGQGAPQGGDREVYADPFHPAPERHPPGQGPGDRPALGREPGGGKGPREDGQACGGGDRISPPPFERQAFFRAGGAARAGRGAKRNLEGMLSKAAERYEEDVEASLGAMSSLLEPAIILAMGVAVAFMVMAVLLPIFDMTKGIG